MSILGELKKISREVKAGVKLTRMTPLTEELVDALNRMGAATFHTEIKKAEGGYATMSGNGLNDLIISDSKETFGYCEAVKVVPGSYYLFDDTAGLDATLVSNLGDVFKAVKEADTEVFMDYDEDEDGVS